MGTFERTGATVELAVDLTTGTAIVDGRRIELPPKEFALLAHLAGHPEKAISRAELIDAIWPETPMMTDQDLYWYVNRLRKSIGDDQRESKVIANRRGFGYFLDLSPDRVAVTGSASGVSVAQAEAAPGFSLDPIPEERPIPLVAIEGDESPAPARPRPRPSLRINRKAFALLAATLTIALLATAWSATQNVAPTPATQDPVAQDPISGASEDSVGQNKHTGDDKKAARPRRDKKTRGAVSGDQFAAAPALGAATNQDPGTTRDGAGRTNQAERPERLPPPPTRFLYHLFSQEIGDHFVTTDQAKASEREAEGYVGGAIARVYTEMRPGTKAISINYGQAYIFVDARPKTSPSSETVSLWFVSNGTGDFFYATSQTDIPQEGWTAILIGYVVPH